MNKINLKAGALAMSYISNEEKVRDMVRALEIRMRRQPHTNTPDGIKISAVNFEPQRYKNISDYISKMNDYVTPPANEGSVLVAFPELCGMTVMSLMPGFSSVLSDLHKLKNLSREDQQEAVLTVCETVQGFVGEIFLNTFSQLARSHRILISGGMFQVENDKIYNRQFLFSENGDVIGVQDKLLLSPTERIWGVSEGERLTPANSRIGKVALLNGSCLAHYEPFWLASRMGCRYAIAGASPFVVSPLKLARFRAQESKMCIIAPGLNNGKQFKLSYASPTAIYAPIAATGEENGIIIQGGDKTITERVNMALAYEQLDLYSDDKNIRFFQKIVKPQ